LTLVPADGAGPVSVAVTFVDAPPVSAAGLKARLESTGALTAREADLLAPPGSAVMVTLVSEACAVVATVKPMLLAPAGTITLAATVAMDDSLRASGPLNPPAGAGPVK